MAELCHSAHRWLLVLMLSVLAAGCSRTASQQQLTSGRPPELQSLQEGVPALATALVKQAGLPPLPSSKRYPVVIDPWIDVITGEQVATTRLMQQELEALAPKRFPQLELLPFNSDSLALRPVVLLGAIAPVAGPGAVEPVTGRPGAFYVYGVLADLASGKIAAADGVWVRAADIDTTPTRIYRDSPVWQADESVVAYLRTLQTRPGDPIDPAYVQSLQVEALITDASAAYDRRDYVPARELFNAAAALPAGGHQLRAYNGLYLTDWALGDQHSATQAFTRLVGYQLMHGRLSVKFLFGPESTDFWPDPAISAPYSEWEHIIARQASSSGACLELTGHTSPSGSTRSNDRLSLARAMRIRADLIAIEPNLRNQITARGAGASQSIVGTGRDDATDLLDRRVDFQLVPCEGARTANS